MWERRGGCWPSGPGRRLWDRGVRTWGQGPQGSERGWAPLGDSEFRPASLTSKRGGSSGWAVGPPPGCSARGREPWGSGGLPRLTCSQGEHERSPFSWNTSAWGGLQPGTADSAARPASPSPPQDGQQPCPPPPHRGCRSGLAQGMVAAAPWDTRPASQKHRGSQGLRQPGGGSRWPGFVHPSVTHECLLCAETSYISASAGHTPASRWTHGKVL